MAGYTLCGSFRATPGDGDRLEALLLEAADLLGAAEGCLLYLVHRADDDADAVWVIEVWTGPDAHRASLDVPGVQEVIGRARPLIAGMGERFELRPVGGLGLPGLGDGRP
jgi:quinol monooxygenase YgiN